MCKSKIMSFSLYTFLIRGRSTKLLTRHHHVNAVRGLCSAASTGVSPVKPRLITNTEILSQPTHLTDSMVVIEDRKEVVDPLKHHDFFGVRNLFSLEDLFRANVHLGHKRGLRHAHMRPFILGSRLEVDVIDITQTVTLLGDALNFLAHIAYRQGVILFLSRHRQMAPVVERTAQECGEYAHCRYWRGGTFTNSTIQYGAVVRHPDVCVFVTTESQGFFQHVAVTESAKMNIPSIGVVDTSCDPRLITYPVPGNDDTPAAIELYCRLFKEAVLRGKSKYNEINTGGK